MTGMERDTIREHLRELSRLALAVEESLASVAEGCPASVVESCVISAAEGDLASVLPLR